MAIASASSPMSVDASLSGMGLSPGDLVCVDGIPLWQGDVAVLNSLFAHVHAAGCHATLEDANSVFCPETYKQAKKMIISSIFSFLLLFLFFFFLII